MQKYILLLRGINVGGKNMLPMKDLVVMLEAMGAVQVNTYIQSGNVVFASATELKQDWCHKFAKLIQEQKGFTPQLFLLQKQDIDKAIANNPFPVEDGKKLHCYFLAQGPRHDTLQDIARIRAASEQTLLKDHLFYLYAPEGIGRSKLAAKVENILRVPSTARNWNTVLKLAQLSDACGG